jgi:hypothetical protein
MNPKKRMKSNNQMRRLQQLLQHRIVFTDDILYFTFKKNRFFASITSGGLIWKCQWQKPSASASIPVFQKTTSVESRPYIRTFESLTDWTETCIQECLEEYHTRYSSWKRVRHQRLDQPMEVLYKHFRAATATPETETNVSLHERIVALQHRLDLVQTQKNDWKKWWQDAHGSEPFPVPDTTEMVVPVEPCNGVKAQPFVLSSETGKYMVLHRLNETAPPECVSWLKKNGPESFQQILSDEKESIVYEPCSDGCDNWQPVDDQTARRYVHRFFSN